MPLETENQWKENLKNQIINACEKFYCLPDNLSSLKQCLTEGFEKIYFDEPSNKEDFTNLLSQINVVLTGFDPHLELKYEPDFIREKSEEVGGVIIENNSGKFKLGKPPLECLEAMDRFRGVSDQNYGFILEPPSGTAIPNNVGYLKINYALDLSFPLVGDKARAAATRAVEALKGKEKIILDLRNVDEGGSPEMIQYLVSFFVAEGIEINQINDKRSGSLTVYSSLETPFKLDAKSVDILIDETTFSALEELAYDLQQISKNCEPKDRFRVVGNKNSKGGANPAYSFPLVDPETQEINKNLVLFIPCCTSINPYTGTNWDGVGVTPDFSIGEEQDALEVVLTELNTRPDNRSLLGKSSIFSSSATSKSENCETVFSPQGP